MLGGVLGSTGELEHLSRLIRVHRSRSVVCCGACVSLGVVRARSAALVAAVHSQTARLLSNDQTIQTGPLVVGEETADPRRSC